MGEPFQASAGGSGGLNTDQKKTATASEALDQLSVGTTYTGHVVEVSATNTYTVRLDSPAGAHVSSVVLASAIVSGILGFHDSRVLALGTAVGMAYGSPSFIFAVFPNAPPDKKNGANRSVAWGDPVSRTNDAGRFASTNVAEDLVAGEFDFDNLFGVGIRFLTGLIAMKSGDRAKVECHLYNDMVRIVSQQFRHIHGLGEDLIFDHGRPTLERGYTSYRHELMGKLTESEPLFDLNGDEVDKDSLGRIEQQARHRYLEYMGFVGDFIHRFVCDPPETLVSLSQAATGRRAGKFWDHIGSDGSYMMQSCSEIRFERVTKIPVFHRKASHESNKTTKARRYRELKRDFVKSWNYGSYDAKDAYRTAYQLRLYARWLTRYQAFARALQLDLEYDIQSEEESPTPDWNNAEADREAANPDLDYYEAYSSFSILRDGSQVLHDGYGSSAVFSNGNVQVSASRHLELEAGGDIRVSCSSFFLKARRHIELSASAGGIILHCFAFMRALCEKGSIHLRSDAKPPGVGAPDEPKANVEPPIPLVVLDAAILLESAEGKTALRSQKQVSIAVEGPPEDPDSRDDDECDIILSTRGSIRGKAQKFVILGAAKDIITSCRNWAVKVSKWYGDVGEILWDKFFLRPKAGDIQVRRLEVQSMVAQGSILASYRGPVPPKDLTGTTSACAPRTSCGGTPARRTPRLKHLWTSLRRPRLLRSRRGRRTPRTPSGSSSARPTITGTPGRSAKARSFSPSRSSTSSGTTLTTCGAARTTTTSGPGPATGCRWVSAPATTRSGSAAKRSSSRSPLGTTCIRPPARAAPRLVRTHPPVRGRLTPYPCASSSTHEHHPRPRRNRRHTEKGLRASD